MEIKEFIKLEDEIKQILIDYPATRNDDMLLYWRYCYNKLRTTKAFIFGWVDFEKLFENNETRKEYKIHPYETVSRCRRKIQAQCPELASERAIRKMKKELESDYKEYARL